MNNLIVTLPNLRDKKSIHEIMSNEKVMGVRYNSGVNELLSVDEVINTLKSITTMYKKKVWIDLKGRQLRVSEWANPRYEAVSLNHEIEIEYPAYILFRGGSKEEIIHTKKNQIVLASPPKEAIGKGQSVNILAKSLNIKGYLTDKDKELIINSGKANLNDYMASFVEDINDLIEIRKLNDKSNIVCKIESLKGMDFINRFNHLNLMAARDDLFTENMCKKDTLLMLRDIISKDENAICASRIFTNIDKNGNFALSDYEDIELMKLMGYKYFMLGDEVRGPHLKKVLEVW